MCFICTKWLILSFFFHVEKIIRALLFSQFSSVSFVLICELIKRIAPYPIHSIPCQSIVHSIQNNFKSLLMFCAIYVHSRLHWHGLSIRELLQIFVSSSTHIFHDSHFHWPHVTQLYPSHKQTQTIILSNHRAHRTENCKTNDKCVLQPQHVENFGRIPSIDRFISLAVCAHLRALSCNLIVECEHNRVLIVLIHYWLCRAYDFTLTLQHACISSALEFRWNFNSLFFYSIELMNVVCCDGFHSLSQFHSLRFSS